MKRSRKTQDGGEGKQSSNREGKSIRKSTKRKEKAKTGKRKQGAGRIKHTTQDRQTSRGVSQE
jgi:hypothetical protein